MPSDFLIDSRVPVTVFKVPVRKEIDDIDAYTTAYQAVGRTGHDPFSNLQRNTARNRQLRPIMRNPHWAGIPLTVSRFICSPHD